MYNTIISTDRLLQHIDYPDWVVFDCRFVLGKPDLGRQKYLENHIPNARYADLDKDLSSPSTAETGRHPLPDPHQLVDKLKDWGVSRNSQVVVYDDVSGSIAGRFWWLLRWLQHEAVAVLDGGIDKWHTEHKPLKSGEWLPSSNSSTTGDFDFRCNDRLQVSADQVERSLGNKDVVIIDSRTPARYSGEKETVDKEGGHIPTAINHSLTKNLDDEGCFLPPQQLREMFEKLQKPTTIHSCGSGVTACHNVLAMKIAGFPDTHLYVGSWSEWIRSSHRPRVQGDEPGSV